MVLPPGGLRTGCVRGGVVKLLERCAAIAETTAFLGPANLISLVLAAVFSTLPLCLPVAQPRLSPLFSYHQVNVRRSDELARPKRAGAVTLRPRFPLARGRSRARLLGLVDFRAAGFFRTGPRVRPVAELRSPIGSELVASPWRILPSTCIRIFREIFIRLTSFWFRSLQQGTYRNGESRPMVQWPRFARPGCFIRGKTWFAIKSFDGKVDP